MTDGRMTDGSMTDGSMTDGSITDGSMTDLLGVQGYVHTRGVATAEHLHKLPPSHLIQIAPRYALDFSRRKVSIQLVKHNVQNRTFL